MSFRRKIEPIYGLDKVFTESLSVAIRRNVGSAMSALTDRTDMGPEVLMSAFDPGCVKTRCRRYDSPVILGGIDEALR